jgi:hypothetical protein
MHQVIVDGLEDYLSGNPNRDFRSHLTACEECRLEVLQYEAVSSLFVPLRPDEAIEPAPGFANRVITRLVDQQQPSFWSMFSFEPALARRVAFASLLLLAVLGSFLISQESSYQMTAPEHLITQAADEDGPSASRDHMLVTLTSYQP